VLNVIGIDLGGTRMRVAVVDPAGSEVWSHVEDVDHGRGAGRGDFGQLVAAVERAAGAAAGKTPGAIGIGATGPLDLAAGTIENPFTLPVELNGPVVEALSRHFGVPVVLLNDADAAALGEARAGVAKDAVLAVTVTLGTGMGVGVVRDGRVQLGAGAVHPEAGHHVIDPSGPECYCGARGCWESLASGSAIGRAMGEGWTAAGVAEAARRGDARAGAVMERAADAIGLGLVNVIAFHAPEVIVLTGGVAASADLFLDRARGVVGRHPYLRPERTRIEPGRLGDRAGVLGAAFAALDEAARACAEWPAWGT
jgi:glucokinase